MSECKLVEPKQKTPEYDFACRVTAAKVVIEIFDNRPSNVNQVVRVRCDRDGVERGIEYTIGPCDPLTIGRFVDLGLQKLMQQAIDE